MAINPDRAVLGIACPFDTRSANGHGPWGAAMFREWLDGGLALHVLHDHSPLITTSGHLATVGVARRFAVVDLPVHGLATLLEIADHAFGDSVLAEIRQSLDLWAGRTPLGLSIGADVWDDMIIPTELSITFKPAFPDAKILAVGQDALDGWDLLTEQHAATAVR